eukprot:2729651-Rhodomonas_salina.1
MPGTELACDATSAPVVCGAGSSVPPAGTRYPTILYHYAILQLKYCTLPLRCPAALSCYTILLHYLTTLYNHGTLLRRAYGTLGTDRHYGATPGLRALQRRLRLLLVLAYTYLLRAARYCPTRSLVLMAPSPPF